MRLAERMPDGAALRDHLIAAAAQTKRPDARLAAQPPAGTEHLWMAFLDLNGARASGLGAAAIAPSEVVAWCALRGVRLTTWEVETLAAVDRAVVAVMNKQQAKKARH